MTINFQSVKVLVWGMFLSTGFFMLSQTYAAETVVFVSIAPQAYFVEQVGGEQVQVHVLIKSNQNPHTFEPTPRQLISLSKAVGYFTCGLPFEKRIVAKIRNSNKQLLILETDRGIKKRPLGHDAGGDGHHHGANNHYDPHFWLSPHNIKVAADNIYRGLARLNPDVSTYYQGNLISFKQAIERTDQKIKKVLEAYQGRSFYVFHPAFGYFGDAYNLIQEAVEIEGKSPSPRQIATLISKAKKEQVRIIFVQPQFDKKSAEAIAHAINGAVVPIDPLARNVLTNLERMATELEKALKR